ncbi:MAG TPA: sugar phosphate nucleotidyltransferase [Actinomycetes bacterium]|nr:sugar phosphate nucleotidyltransferase [Actinomycetes bacterium]
MKAVIMAGGEGTRLRPLTANQPKPMLPVANRPIMEHIIRHVRGHGFTDIVVTVQFLASQVRTYFGDGKDMGVDLTYATETTPLGTAGSVRNAAEQLRETFLVISGDALTDVDLDEVVTLHRKQGAMATVVLKRMENPLEFGIVITKEDGRIERFLEKPHWGQVFSDAVNTGIYVLEPEVFELIPEGRPADFSSDVFPALLARGLPMFGHVADGYWEDVGNLEAYRRAHEDILDGRVRVEIRGFEVRPGVWVGEGADLDVNARLDGPVLIGDFAKIEAEAQLREYTVVGANAVVKSGAFLHRAIVHEGAYIGAGAHLRGCVIGRSADVKQGGRVEDGAVVGNNADIGRGAVIKPSVKIYPFKMVEPGALVNTSIIWEGRGARTLFGEHGVAGLANVDVTPELALRLAMAIGTTLRKGDQVTLGRDASRVSRAFKRALIVGLNSTGVDCDDLETAPAPVVRFAARRAPAASGMYVRTGRGDSQAIEIAVFGDDGGDVDESARRRIERLYHREEFRRAFGREMGQLRYPARAGEYYTEAVLDGLDVERVRARAFKVVIDAGAGTCTLVLPLLLARLELDTLIVNGQLDEAQVAPGPEQRLADVERLCRLVTASGADLGVRLDSVGERITLVDGDGAVVPLDRALLLLVDLVARSHAGGRIALPVSTTARAAELAAAGGCEVVGTKLAASAIMAAAQGDGVVFAGAEGGGYVFPALHPAYDALTSFGRLLELLALQDVTLAEAVARLPATSVVRRRIATPWERKGTIMRQVVEGAKGKPTDATDGVKVFEDGGWVLVIPDPVEPVTNLWAESDTPERTVTLADRYEQLVRRSVTGRAER